MVCLYFEWLARSRKSASQAEGRGFGSRFLLPKFQGFSQFTETLFYVMITKFLFYKIQITVAQIWQLLVSIVPYIYCGFKLVRSASTIGNQSDLEYHFYFFFIHDHFFHELLDEGLELFLVLSFF